MVTNAEDPALEAPEGLLTAGLSPHPNIAQTLDHMYFVRVRLSVPRLTFMLILPAGGSFFSRLMHSASAGLNHHIATQIMLPSQHHPDG